MKKSTILKMTAALALMFLGYANSWGQTPTLSVNSQTLSRHGYNAAGNPVASEATDTVTTGSTIRYYVIPDGTANPSYTAVLTGTLTSSFKWDVNTKTGTADTITTGNAIVAVGTYGSFTNYRQVTWKGVGTLNLTVAEISGSGCSSGTTQTVPVSIIAAPTTEFSSASATTRCITGSDGLLTETLTAIPISYASSVTGNRKLIITYNVTCSNPGFTAITGATANVTEGLAGSGTFDLPGNLTHYGTYTITITAINDRISTKSSFAGVVADVNTNGTTQGTYTLVINRTPVTGPIYHLPNM